MKKIWFTIAFVNFLVNFSFLQNWRVASTWVYDQLVIGPESIPATTLKIIKDSSILDKTYFKLVSNYPLHKPYFLIRKDNEKIFIWSELVNKEFLLYDFNLKVGDTSETYTDFFDEEILKYKVDSILVDPYFEKKTLYVSMINGVGIFFHKIIVGLGDENWLFPTLGFVDPPPGGRLICYIDDDVKIPQTSSCIVNSCDIENEVIKLLPNPAYEELKILGAHNFYYKIFNVTGSLFKSGFLKNESMSIENLKTGFYYIEVKIQDKIKILPFFKY
ncbi:MAG: hypothetical protein RLZZ546_208 [Bacteroidota bacterium]|jgi:hypothetical protein